MKKSLVALFFFSMLSIALPADYYHYFSQRMDLNKREDKIVIVTNDAGDNRTAMENEISSMLQQGDELKNVYSNTYQVVFKDGFSPSKVQGYINSFANRNDIIKFITPAYYTDDWKVTIICADEFIVKLKSESDRNKLDILNIENSAQIIESFPGSRQFNIKTFNGNSKTSLNLSEIYLATGLFEYCEPNFIYPDFCLLHFTPNDPLYSTQWPLNNTGQTITANAGGSNGVDPGTYDGLSGSDMDVNSAWDFTTGSSLIEIGVMDTGIDSTHPDLAANVLTGYDAYYNTNSVPRDSGSHGTATAGIIAAVSNNALGVAGISYGCKVRSYRIFNAAGTTTTAAITRAFQVARTNNAAILSNSWGGGTPAASSTQAIDSCAAFGNSGKGCLILFSSGNNGRNPPSPPSYFNSVISIGASTAYDQKKAPGTGNQYWWGGNFGSAYLSDGVNSYVGDLDCVAPTINPTTDRQGTAGYNTSAGTAGDYTTDFNGTSCSCPNAAGVAGLIYSVNTSFTASQVKDFLLRGCDKIDNIAYDSTKTYGKWNSYFGYGRVNAYKSVRLAAGVDVIAPTIVHDNVESHNSTYPTTITTDITDIGGGTVDNASPKIIYRTNKNNAGWSAFDTASYTTQASSSFTFKIPGYGWETEVQYYLTALDNSGNRAYFPLHAPDTTNLCYYSIGSIQSVTQTITGPTTISSAGTYSSANTNFASFKILKTKVRLFVRHQALLYTNVMLSGPMANKTLNVKSLFSTNLPAVIVTGISNATVVDSANQFWYQGTMPYSGASFKPEYSMRGYNGLNASGNWKLFFYITNSGFTGTFDSAFVTFYKTSGTLSPSASINSSSDSIVSFDGTSVDTTDFYVKNAGNSSLTISGTSFTGTYAAKFSLLSSPGSIAANDSGLFRIRCNPLAPRPKGGNGSLLDDAENAQLNISTNDPSKPTIIVSLQTPAPLPVELANFTSTVEKNTVKLNWATTYEQNNSGFDVERKLSSGSDWTKVTNLAGAGNSNTQINYSYTDNFVSTGKYNYRLKQIDFNGNYKYYELAAEVIVGIPSQFNLSQNFPNPFNPSTKINFDLPFDSKVQIKVFDMTGREMTQILNESKSAGYYTAQFNASALSSGIYFYQINATGGNQSFVKTMKMVLIK